ncbi:MAG: hypothetical protein U1F66_09650 [bacterium]
MRPRPATGPSPWRQSNYAALAELIESEQRRQDLGSIYPEFRSLLTETHEGILREAMTGLARRLREAGRDPLAERIDSLLGVHSKPHLAEQIAKQFLNEASRPATWIGMGLGSLAYRTVRFGALSRLLSSAEAGWWTRGLGARALAGTAGFLAELPAFTLGGELVRSLGNGKGPDSSDWGSRLMGGALLLGSAKLGGLLGASFPGGRALGETAARTLWTHSCGLAGVLLGQGLERGLGLESREGGLPPLLSGLLTYLQMQVSGRIATKFLGGKWQSLERRLDLAAKGLLDNYPRPAEWPGARWVTAATAAGNFHRQGEEISLPGIFLSESTKPLDSQPTRKAWRDRFASRFPAPGTNNYTEEIFSTVAETPLPQEAWRETLLEAFAQSPKRGSLSQLFTADALKKLFSFDALNTGTGSFDLALQQFAFERVLEDPQPQRRHNLLRLAVFLMEHDPSRAAWTRFLELGAYHLGLRPESAPKYPDFFHWLHAGQVQREWGDLQQAHRDLLLNFVYDTYPQEPAKAQRLIRVFGAAVRRYPRHNLERALDYATENPLGNLILRRIVLLSAAEEPVYKLKDLADPRSARNTTEVVASLAARGYDFEGIARALAGTRHTAYLDDLRLARKVAALTLEANQIQGLDPTWRRLARRRLRDAIQSVVDRGAELSPQILWKLLETNARRQVADAKLAWERGRFKLEVLGDSAFQALLRRCGLEAQSDLAVFVQASRPLQKDRIVIRDLPAAGTTGITQRYEGVLTRLLALAHELEHWRHFSGNFPGREPGIAPFRLQGIGHEDRLVTEVMASLEEERWYRLHHDEDTSLARTARRLGQNLPLFFRDFNDWSYFQDRRRKATLGIFPQ